MTLLFKGTKTLSNGKKTWLSAKLEALEIEKERALPWSIDKIELLVVIETTAAVKTVAAVKKEAFVVNIAKVSYKKLEE